MTIYLPLLFRLSISMGAEEKYPANWLDGNGSRTAEDPRFEVQFNPNLFAMLVEELLQKENGVVLHEKDLPTQV